MRPTLVPNLISLLSYPPWKEGLNWDLYATRMWEKRIPFHSYVYPDAVPDYLLGQVLSCTQFGALPAELQFRILAFCSANTLFQLMHVSSTLRREASKLFWANSKAYFHVDAYWLLEGGYPAYTYWDLSFLDHVQNVEIEYEAHADTTIYPYHDGGKELQQDTITTFWNSFKKTFLNAKRVIINSCMEDSAWLENDEPVTPPLRALMQACPPGVEAYVLIVEEQRPFMDTSLPAPLTRTKWQRSMYQLVAGSVWVENGSNKDRNTILMPMKKFNGPVGEHERLQYDESRILLQINALWPLMLEVVARDHVKGRKRDSFSCPSHRCDAHFAKAVEWIVHAAESHPQDWSEFDILPTETRAVFKNRARALEQCLEDINTRYNKIRDEWHKEEGKNQGEIERGWIEQLDNEEAWYTGEKGSESRLWRQFVMTMSPTWEGIC
jgi:hypothetical protein